MPSKKIDVNKTEVPKEVKYRKLRSFNLVMGFMHLIQGILMIVLSNDTTYPIFTNYLKFDTATMSCHPIRTGLCFKIWSGCGGIPADLGVGTFQPGHIWLQLVYPQSGEGDESCAVL